MHPSEFHTIERNRFPLSVCTHTRSPGRRAFQGGFLLGFFVAGILCAAAFDLFNFMGWLVRCIHP